MAPASAPSKPKAAVKATGLKEKGGEQTLAATGWSLMAYIMAQYWPGDLVALAVPFGMALTTQLTSTLRMVASAKGWTQRWSEIKEQG